MHTRTVIAGLKMEFMLVSGFFLSRNHFDMFSIRIYLCNFFSEK